MVPEPNEHDEVPPAAPNGAETEPSPAATATDAPASGPADGGSTENAEEPDDREEMRTFMAEYRADKKAVVDAAAAAAAKKRTVPAPKPKPPKASEQPKGKISEADPPPEAKKYGSRRWFGDR